MLTLRESITAILRREWKDRGAWNIIYGATYRRLKTIAAALLDRERSGHTLQPTDLVNESFFRVSQKKAGFADKDHFYNTSARAMRQVLIDHSRQKRAAKRLTPDALPELLLAMRREEIDPDLRLDLEDVLEALAGMEQHTAETVRLRYLEGLTIEELCERQKREAWRVRADCDFALDWMAKRLSKGR